MYILYIILKKRKKVRFITISFVFCQKCGTHLVYFVLSLHCKSRVNCEEQKICLMWSWWVCSFPTFFMSVSFFIFFSLSQEIYIEGKYCSMCHIICSIKNLWATREEYFDDDSTIVLFGGFVFIYVHIVRTVRTTILFFFMICIVKR